MSTLDVFSAIRKTLVYKYDLDYETITRLKTIINKELRMKKQIIVEEDEEERPKGWTPKVITGGKGPPDTPGGNDEYGWLQQLPKNTTFLAQGKKDTGFALGQFSIIFKGDKGVLLFVQGSKEPVWVDPTRFCRDYRHYETLQTAEDYELEHKANQVLDEHLEQEHERITQDDPPF